MITLFATDLDGCLTEPFVSPNWDLFTQIRQLNARAKLEDPIPPLTICTGRPQPYAEAIAQMMDIDLPILFESGAGMYHPKEVSIEWADFVTNDRLEQILEIKEFLRKEIVPSFDNVTLEFSKYSDAGLIHTDTDVISEIHEIIQKFVDSNKFDTEVHVTDVSVNVLIKGSNKGVGLRWLSKKLEIPLENMAYIGDSSGDIPALKIVGKAFAPMNASEKVKQISGIHVRKESSTAAMLASYRELISTNEAHFLALEAEKN